MHLELERERHCLAEGALLEYAAADELSANLGEDRVDRVSRMSIFAISAF